MLCAASRRERVSVGAPRKGILRCGHASAMGAVHLGVDCETRKRGQVPPANREPKVSRLEILALML